MCQRGDLQGPFLILVIKEVVIDSILHDQVLAWGNGGEDKDRANSREMIARNDVGADT